MIEGKEAHFADYFAKNETIVRVNFYAECQCRIGSLVVRIPSDKELTEENIWEAASVVLV
jgi:hypothetical protein